MTGNKKAKHSLAFLLPVLFKLKKKSRNRKSLWLVGYE
jgi:hypothetical protein